MNNPSHKKKKSQEPDAPQWYIDAHFESQMTGTAVVLIHSDGNAEHVPFAVWEDLIKVMKEKRKVVYKS